MEIFAENGSGGSGYDGKDKFDFGERWSWCILGRRAQEAFSGSASGGLVLLREGGTATRRSGVTLRWECEWKWDVGRVEVKCDDGNLRVKGSWSADVLVESQR